MRKVILLLVLGATVYVIGEFIKAYIIWEDEGLFAVTVRTLIPIFIIVAALLFELLYWWKKHRNKQESKLC